MVPQFLMSDTKENQAIYPQPNQSAGCGFPIAKMVVMFSLAGCSNGRCW